MAVEVHDLGNSVECDGCGTDYTHSDKQGGVLFGSQAYCPECAPHVEQKAIHYGEQKYIRGRCPEGMAFREWVLILRGGDNTIRVLTGDDAKKAIGL